jgi:hypothetical protein
MKMNILKIATLIIILLFLLYVYRVMTLSEGMMINDEDLPKSYEAIELKTQSDFRMIGKVVYEGGGTEPGFSFKTSIAGTKFGFDLASQYGATRYVGYLDLTNQSTSSIAFTGKMLDKGNSVVDAIFKINVANCTTPSGVVVPYSVDISVGPEVLHGCGNIVAN